MTEPSAFTELIITIKFLDDYADRKFNQAERRRIVRTLALLQSNEKHPSLRIHRMQGELAGLWSASVTDSIRVTFERRADGRKVLLRVTRHYDD